MDPGTDSGVSRQEWERRRSSSQCVVQRSKRTGLLFTGAMEETSPAKQPALRVFLGQAPTMTLETRR